jgi:hypothetical protein
MGATPNIHNQQQYSNFDDSLMMIINQTENLAVA